MIMVGFTFCVYYVSTQPTLHSPHVLLPCYKWWSNNVSNLKNRSTGGSVAFAIKKQYVVTSHTAYKNKMKMKT